MSRPCAFEDCVYAHLARGLCMTHYGREKRRLGPATFAKTYPALGPEAPPHRTAAELDHIREQVEAAARPLFWMALLHLATNPEESTGDREWETA